MTGERALLPLSISVLTVSDTRTSADDRSGDTLAERIGQAGHKLFDRAIVPDEPTAIREAVTQWCHDPNVDVVITTGGTGFTGRDVTPEALEPLFDKRMDGFSAVFHRISFDKIGVSTIQSRATAGLIAQTFVFVLPARRLSRCLGRHSQGPARLPASPLQLRRNHAAPRRASASRCSRPSALALASPHPGFQDVSRPRRPCHEFDIRTGRNRAASNENAKAQRRIAA